METTKTVVTDVNRRHDFALLFDVTDGNPNGDPDAGNAPRVDPETLQGLVTDVAIKRKVRDYVDVARGDEGRFKIYVQSGGPALNAIHKRAYDAEGLKSTGAKQDRKTVDTARKWMCSNFYDVRMFGAVMTTGVNCGQVRGPMQLTFSRSHDPILALDITITRVAVTREEDANIVATEDGSGASGKNTEIGRKAIVPYGLYRAHGFFNPHFAADTGASAEDLSLFWDALRNMWDFDHSAARGMMGCEGLYVFSHESTLGNAPAHDLLRRVTVRRNEGVIAPRAASDYAIAVDEAEMPAGVTLTRLVG